MSELQTALLAVGLVIIVAVLAFNKWQKANYKRNAEQGFSVRHEDLLVGDRVAVDSVTSHAPPRTTGRSETETGFEEQNGWTVEHEVIPVTSQDDGIRGVNCSPIDHCVDFGSKSEIVGSRVIGSAVRRLADFSKVVHLERYDPETRAWKNLGHDSRCSVFRGRIQLVDRRGAITEKELNRFDAAVRVIAREIGAVAYDSNVGEGLKRAKDWDAFCTEVDVQIGLNVVASTSPFSGSQVDQSLVALGAYLGLDGAYHFHDSHGQTRFRILNLDNTPFSAESRRQTTMPGVTFEIDVPRTLATPDLADAFFETAGRFAESVGGMVVDDNQAAVSAAAFSSIRLQLLGIHTSMQNRGCPAGQAMALRLFS